MSKEWTSKVDCIAYSAIKVLERGHTDEEIENFRFKGVPLLELKIVNEEMASCCHPAREGYQEPNGQLGCLLVDFNTGELTERAICEHRTPHGSEQAPELQKRIRLAFERHAPSPDNF